MDKTPFVKENKINIGMVYSCNNWEYYGVVIGVFGFRLYYFTKEKELGMARHELVSFVVDEENPNEAKCVISLERYEVVSGEHNVFRRPDGKYCDPEEWEAMQRGVPFISASTTVKCLFSPFLNNGIQYYENVLSGANKYAVELFLEKKKYKDVTEISNEEIKVETVRLRKYIEEFDSTSIINSFTVVEGGWLQRRVGRDDHFNYSTTRKVESDDMYINQLLKTGMEDGYYATNSYEENYSRIDEQATKEGIRMALSEYDKDDHFAFLLNCYIKNRQEQILQKSKIKYKLEGLFNVDMMEFRVGYIADYSYKREVEKFNKA